MRVVPKQIFSRFFTYFNNFDLKTISLDFNAFFKNLEVLSSKIFFGPGSH